MTKNYFKIAFRSIWRNKIYTIINVMGLGVAMTCMMVSMLFWNKEHSWDCFHTNNPNIYRITTQLIESKGDQPKIVGGTGQVQGAAFSKAIPEIESYVRILGGNIYNDVSTNGKAFSLQSLFVDKNFFEVFTFKFLEGSKTSSFADINSVVITESTAMKFFNRTNVVGQILQMENSPSFQRMDKPLVISAVVSDPPSNSSIQFDALFPFDFLQLSFDDLSWLNAYLGTYIVLQPNANLYRLPDKFQAVFDSNSREQIATKKAEFNYEPTISYGLQSMQDIHLHPLDGDGYETGIVNTSRTSHSNLLLCIAIFILLMAIINFINISISNSLKRAKEVGVRKVAGGSQWDIIKHFFTESFLVCFLALLIGLMILQVTMPLFNKIVNEDLALIDIFERRLMAGILLIFGLVVILSSAYPAYILAKLNPAKILYNRQKPTSIGVFNRALVVIQFSLGICLLAATLVHYDQMNFIKSKDLGYNPSNILQLELNGNFDYNQKEAFFKSELSKLSAIKSVSVGRQGNRHKAAIGNNQFDAIHKLVDENYLAALDLKLLQGQWFSKETPSLYEEGVIVNEAFVLHTKLEDPIGKSVTLEAEYNGPVKTIIGVVKDFHLGSLREMIQPLVMYTNDVNGMIYIKYDDAKTQEVIAHTQKVFKSALPNGVFNFNFMDDINSNQYQSEQRMQKIINLATLISLLICFLGLFGLSHLSAQQRTKEVGLRKVLGASLVEIVQVLIHDFIKLISIAFLVSIPIAWFYSNKWLEGYAYRIDSVWQILVLASILSFFIALFTVSYQAIKAALVNPMESLKSE